MKGRGSSAAKWVSAIGVGAPPALDGALLLLDEGAGAALVGNESGLALDLSLQQSHNPESATTHSDLCHTLASFARSRQSI